MTASLAQTSVSTLVAIALFSLSAEAEPGPAPTSRAEREIAITGAADEPPAVVYGAPDVALAVIFDGPLKKDGAVAVQGADVRSHPFIPDALVITPSRSLAAARSSVPVLVPLAGRVVDLTLAFSPERRDAIVRIVHRASTAGPALTEGEKREVLSDVARTVLDSEACASADAAAIPRHVIQSVASPFDLLVCGGGTFAYMRVSVPADCTAETARMTRGEESVDVLLLQQSTRPCREGICWLAAARAPPGDGLGFELELFAQDGVPCHRVAVDLKPPSP